MVPLIVKSFALVVSSGTVNVLVLPLFSATGQLMIAPTPEPEIFVIVTSPPRVNSPEPVIDEADDPICNSILAGAFKENVLSASVVPALMVSVPFIVVFAAKVFVPLPDVFKLL